MKKILFQRIDLQNFSCWKILETVSAWVALNGILYYLCVQNVLIVPMLNTIGLRGALVYCGCGLAWLLPPCPPGWEAIGRLLECLPGANRNPGPRRRHGNALRPDQQPHQDPQPPGGNKMLLWYHHGSDSQVRVSGPHVGAWRMAVDAYIDSAFAITKVSKKYEVRSMQQHTEYIFTGASLILMDNAVSNGFKPKSWRYGPRYAPQY